MVYRPENFQRLPGAGPGFKIRTDDSSPLILVKATGEAAYGRRRTDKDSIIERFDPEADLLLWAWVGQWRTEVFMLSKEEVDKHYK